MTNTLLERFNSKFSIASNGCWQWNGTINGSRPRGYFSIKDRPRLAHRVAWELFRGPIPKASFLCHTCDNSLCVNPDHMYVGTHEENTKDAIERGRYEQGERRYNWRRSTGLVDRIRDLRTSGAKISDLCSWLEIGRNTYYRVARRLGEDFNRCSRRAAKGNYQLAALVR